MGRNMMMSLSRVLVLIVALEGTRSAKADSYARTTHVNIHIPRSLHQEGGYEHVMGHFGTSSMTRAGHLYMDTNIYGSMSLPIVQAPVNSSDLCLHVVDDTVVSQQPHVLIVTRSPHCTFVTQARRAQHYGAAGLVIVDDTCICVEAAAGYCNNTNNATACQNESPIVVDDGSGGDVTIPTVFLKKQDGQAIFKALSDPQQTVQVMVDLKWQSQPSPITTPKQTELSTTTAEEQKLHYGMWLDLQDMEHTPQFTQSILHIALAVGQQARFHPSYMLYNGTRNNCVAHTSAGYCENTCTNSGRYCYPSTYGSQVVMEMVRRLCIWKHHGDDAANTKTGVLGEAWWNYVSYFDENCAAHIYGYNRTAYSPDLAEACRQKAYERAKLSTDEIHQCIQDSGGVDMDTTGANNLLEAELAAKEQYGVLQTPSIWIDGKVLPTYWRAPSATALLEAVCGGFQSAVPKLTVPTVCTACLAKQQYQSYDSNSEEQLIACAKKHYDPKYKPSGNGGSGSNDHGAAPLAWKIFFWLAALAAIGGAGRYGYKKYQERLENGDGESDNAGGGGALVNALGSRLMDPIFSYMPLNQNHGNHDSTRNVGLINGVLRGSGEENITYYE